MNFIKKYTLLCIFLVSWLFGCCYGSGNTPDGMVKVTVVNQSAASFCLKGKNSAHCVDAGASESFSVQSRYFYTRFGLISYWEQDQHNHKKILLSKNGKTLDFFIQKDKSILAAGMDKRVGLDLDLYLTWHPLGSLF